MSRWSPPSITIQIALEQRPKVWLCCRDSAEEARLWIWLANPGIAELIDAALRLAEREPAA